MPTFRLTYGTVLEFEGQTAGEVVPFLHSRHVLGSGEREDVFCVGWLERCVSGVVIIIAFLTGIVWLVA